jgi:hypothetical protein
LIAEGASVHRYGPQTPIAGNAMQNNAASGGSQSRSLTGLAPVGHSIAIVPIVRWAALSSRGGIVLPVKNDSWFAIFVQLHDIESAMKPARASKVFGEA